MARIDQFSRLRHHRLTTSGQSFTVPLSEDHTDETWLTTDLYLGEIGINLTDDKIFFRSNNGIVQISTTGSSAGGTISNTLWDFVTPNIQIGATWSIDAVTPKTGYYTDLGSQTLPFKDLYLGGSSGGSTKVDVNAGVELTSAAGNILTTDGVVSSAAPIEIHSQSSNVNKSRPLFLNTRAGLVSGSNYITTASSQTITIADSNYVFVAGTNQLNITTASNTVYLGKSHQRDVWQPETTWAGGDLAVRSIDDDGSGQYDKSEWITSQNRLSTANANVTDIVNIPWTDLTNYGEVVQIKAFVIGTVINSADIVYSSELCGVFSVEAGGTPHIIGVPTKNEWSSFSGTQPESDLTCDANGFYVKVKGIVGSIQWLCSYQYHRLIKVY